MMMFKVIVGFVLTTLCTAQNQGDLRLHRGDASTGIVQVYDTGTWKTLCATNFGVPEAQVVCRTLGFQDGSPLPNTAFGQLQNVVTYPDVLSTTGCVSGAEINITSCDFDTDAECANAELQYASVKCLTGNEESVVDFSVKLDDEGTADSGYFSTVLVYKNNTWGRICGQYWDDLDAEVVCKQLGFLGGVASYSQSDWSVPTLLMETGCTGNETNLSQCNNVDVDCLSDKVGDVVCYKTQEPRLQLVGGKTHYGHVVLSVDGMQGLFCDTSPRWSFREAFIVCKSLGYTNGFVIPSSAKESLSSAGTDVVFIESLTCTGEEENMFQCENSGWKNLTGSCNVSNTAALYCYTNVRFVMPVLERDNVHMGRVELLDNGVWRSVCADTFTQMSADVVCKQFGFTHAEILLPRNFRNGFSSVSPVNSLSCTGTESSLLNCTYTVGRCMTYTDHAALVCTQDNVTNDFKVSLSDGYHGDVVLERYGVQGHVCRAGWDDRDADILCKSLNFVTGFAFGSRSASHRPYPIWATNFTCGFGEDSLLDCGFQTGLSTDWPCAEDDYVAAVLCYSGRPADPIVGKSGSIAADNFRAEVYYTNNQTGWGTICDDGWSNNDALVYCRELGYPDGLVSRTGYQKGDSSQLVVMSGVQCTGTESSILQCPNNGWLGASTSCQSHSRDAGVECYTWVKVEPSQIFGAVKYHSGENYGLVCADGFDDNAARVVCREQTPVSFTYGKSLCCSAAGPQNQEFTLSNVSCTGSESQLRDCSYNDDNPQCSSGQYATVHCGFFFQGYIDMEANPVVTVTYLTQKGYVCTEGFTAADATVVCRELGFTYSETFKASAAAYLYNIRWLRGFGCQGNENLTSECSSLDWGNIGICSWDAVAAVRCTNNLDDLQFEIRIANGTTTGGRVELKIDNQWGTICGNNFNKNEASVICKQLGFHDGVARQPGYYGAGEGPVHVSGFQCEGNETSITDCIWSGYENVGSLCDHSKDAAVNCFDNIELVGSTTPNYGRLEVFDSTEGDWVAVCDNGIFRNEALLICRQLGYTDGLVQQGSPLGPTDRKIGIAIVNCADVTKCVFENGECSSGRYAAVYCSVNTVTLENADISLPQNSFYGPVSISRYGLLGHICSVGFDDSDALVTCKELGFQSGQALNTFKTAGFPIIQGSVMCNGDESRLRDCSRGSFMVDPGCYDSDTVAGVMCYNPPGLSQTSTPLDAETGRMTTIAGLELNSQILRFEYSDFTDVDAAVYCSSLGYAGGEVYKSNQGGFGVSQIDCAGTETSILLCPGIWDPAKNENQSGDLVGVICYTSVRLVGGDPSYYGVVYTSKGVNSGPVCSSGFDVTDAAVACKSLSYNSGIALCCAPFGLVEDPAILTNVQCTGSERQFIDCPHNDVAANNAEICKKNYAAVVCYNTPKNNDYSLSLSGSTTYTGHVIISYYGINGTICMDGWTDNSASVACKELGFRRGLAYNAARSSISPGPFWTSNVQCTGNENRLSDCQWTELGTVDQCTSTISQAGVICYDNEGIFYRLGGTGEMRYGRVELSINGEWRSICNLFWESLDSQVLCKMLGYSTGDAFTGAVNGSLSGPVWEVNYQCDGTESNLNLCVSTGWRVSTQSTCAQHTNDAGTFCYKSVKLSTGVGRETDQGAVLFYQDDQWYTVCCEGFNDTSARVVCQELGFIDGQALSCSSFGELNEYSFLRNYKIGCSGNETDVRDCLVQEGCQGDQYASVVCYSFLNATEPTPPEKKDEFDWRPIVIAVVLFVVLLVIAIIVAVFVVKYRRRKKIEKSKESFDGKIVSENLDGSIIVTNRLTGLVSTPEVPRVQYNRNRTDENGDGEILYDNTAYSRLKPEAVYDNHGYSTLQENKNQSPKKEPNSNENYLTPIGPETGNANGAPSRKPENEHDENVPREPDLDNKLPVTNREPVSNVKPTTGSNKTVINVKAEVPVLRFANNTYNEDAEYGNEFMHSSRNAPSDARDVNRLSLSQQDEVHVSKDALEDN